jgi:tellurite resistance protein TehA-like permease
MRLGPLEIAIIIVVIIAIAVIARIVRFRGTAKQNEVSSVSIPVKSAEERTSRPRSLLRKIGLAFILTGVILLIAGISMFRWAFQSYLWSYIIVAIGLVIVFLSRKK